MTTNQPNNAQIREGTGDLDEITEVMAYAVDRLVESYPDLTVPEKRIARQSAEITARRLLGREVIRACPGDCGIPHADRPHTHDFPMGLS